MDGRFVLAEVVCTVVAPSVVLIAASSPDRLGPFGSLVVALLFPAFWAIVSQVRERAVSGLAMVSLLSVGVSGGLGLATVDARWFAWKEALVPAALGVLAIASAPTRVSVVPALLDRLLDPERTHAVLSERGGRERFDRAARRGTIEMGLVLCASAVISFALATVIVVAPGGSEAFAGQLGRYTALSVPVVTLPVLVASVFVLRRVLIGLETASGVALEELLR
jgi:hypothetical protein